MDAGSAFLLSLLGERGVHARGSAGVTEPPLSIAVEVEMVVEAVEAEERR